jgi:hypothetical protein
MYTALKSLTFFSRRARLSVNMSNDIKLEAQGARARAARSSARCNVAQVYPDAGRVFRPEALVFTRPACRQLTAALSQGPRIPSLTHEIKSPNCV